jgi:glycosyltransferase involved in cell wall biosynthesis
MPRVEELANSVPVATAKLPVSVIVAARNEEKNLPRCLEGLRDVGEVYVIDSGSTDATPEIARSFGAKVIQFHYRGGWPKKRQWVIDTFPFDFEWVFLVDADEALTPELREEIRRAIQNPEIDGYYVSLECIFSAGFSAMGARASGSCRYFGGGKARTSAA